MPAPSPITRRPRAPFILGPRDVNGNPRRFRLGFKEYDALCTDETRIQVSAETFRELAKLCGVALNAEDAEALGEEE